MARPESLLDVQGRVSAICSCVASKRITTLPQRCEKTAWPGVTDEEPHRDWSAYETTDDQTRIENRLSLFVDANSDILHVGLGNSRLAMRFSASVNSITGITVSQQEVDLAVKSGLANYHASVWNKYQYFLSAPRHGFDAIVDNNPTSFTCCIWHLSEMMAWYADSLRNDGAIFTDAVGLSWVLGVAEAVPGSGFNFAQWAELGRCAGLEALAIDSNVYALFKPSARQRVEWLQYLAAAPPPHLMPLPFC
jgi:hypothetical protein